MSANRASVYLARIQKWPRLHAAAANRGQEGRKSKQLRDDESACGDPYPACWRIFVEKARLTGKEVWGFESFAVGK
jgi:hypothetical protein